MHRLPAQGAATLLLMRQRQHWQCDPERHELLKRFKLDLLHWEHLVEQWQRQYAGTLIGVLARLALDAGGALRLACPVAVLAVASFRSFATRLLFLP